MAPMRDSEIVEAPNEPPLTRPAATLSPAGSGGEARERRLSKVLEFKARTSDRWVPSRRLPYSRAGDGQPGGLLLHACSRAHE